MRLLSIKTPMLLAKKMSNRARQARCQDSSRAILVSCIWLLEEGGCNVEQQSMLQEKKKKKKEERVNKSASMPSC